MPSVFPITLAVTLVAALAIEACHGPSPVEVLGSPSNSFAIVMGEELTIEMGGVGPFFYVSPPTLSGSTLEFIGENAVPSTLNSPAGEPELFHFKGVARGQTVILFQGYAEPDIADTVIVL